MADISMAGVGGVSVVTMHGKVVSGFKYVPGMAVALTGENEVGLGAASGSAVFGIVTKVEVDAADDIVLGVQTSGFTDVALMTATAADRPAVGDIACCDNKGAIVKPPATAPDAYRGIVTAINAGTNTATIAL